MRRCDCAPHAPNRFRPYLLLQDKVWIDRYGCERDPRTIDLEYATNLLHFIHRSVTRAQVWDLIRWEYEALLGPMYELAGDQAQLAIEAEADELLDQLSLDREEWLALYSPLYGLLLERVTNGT